MTHTQKRRHEGGVMTEPICPARLFHKPLLSGEAHFANGAASDRECNNRCRGATAHFATCDATFACDLARKFRCDDFTYPRHGVAHC
jgi:hypothetical protein